MLKGDLTSFSLGEVFQSLAINNHTGTLKISSKTHPEKLIYFDNGEITLFSTGGAHLPRVGDILLRMGKITPQELEEALFEQRKTKAILGEVLLTKGMVTEEDIRSALETKICEEIYDLFLWNEGTFEFHMDYFPQELIDDLQKKTRIALKTSNVVMEGLRQLDEWQVIKSRIQTFDEIFVHSDAPCESEDKRHAPFLEAINGANPVKDIIKFFPGSRFDCCKTLFDLLEAGLIRHLTVEECVDLAGRSVAAHEYTQAAVYFRFAAQLRPNDAGLHKSLGDALSGVYQDIAANQAYYKAMRLYHEGGDFKSVAELGERLLNSSKLEDEDLEKVFHAFFELKLTKKAVSTGSSLASSLQSKGQVEKAAAVLESLTRLEPNDLNLRIQIATLFEKAGDPGRAIKHLEEVSLTLEKEKKFRDLIKILRVIADLDPKRQEIKQKINAVQLLQERMEQRKKRRLTVLGVGLACLLVLTLIPFLYEIKASEFLNHAKRLEQISMLSMDFEKAKAAYEELIKNYSLSFKVAEAQEALKRISSIERSMLDQIEMDMSARKEEHDFKLLAMKESLATELREAEGAERSGSLEKATQIYSRIVKEYADLPATKNILFPLHITSEPTGARVFQDGVEIGKTPFVHRYKPGTTLNLIVMKTSCENAQQTLDAKGQWQLHFKLKRCPFGEFSPVVAIQQPMAAHHGHIVLASRDGNLYALDPKAKSAIWQRTVGRFADRVSNIELQKDEVYLGTVTGEVTALSATTGKSRWVTKVGSSVLAAPALSPDAKWLAVGTTSGMIHVLDNETGATAGKFATENEIMARPLFSGDLLIAGSTDNYLYGYSLSRQALDFVQDLSSDILLDLLLDETSVLVGTADGKVHRFDLPTRKVLWSRSLNQSITAMVLSSWGLHAGTSDGKLMTLDKKTGNVASEVALGSGSVSGITPFLGSLYLTLDSGKVVAVDLSGKKVAWDYQSDNPFLCPLLALDGVLYLGGASGKIQFLQVLE